MTKEEIKTEFELRCEFPARVQCAGLTEQRRSCPNPPVGYNYYSGGFTWACTSHLKPNIGIRLQKCSAKDSSI